MMNDYLLLFKLSQADDDFTITKIAEWALYLHTKAHATLAIGRELLQLASIILCFSSLVLFISF